MRQILQILGWAIVIVMLSQLLGMTSARADVNSQDKNGETALIKAAAEGQADQLKALLKSGADLNIKDKEGNTALLYAVSLGSIEMAKILIEEGADLKMKYGVQKENILFECARHDLDKIAELVLKKDKSLLQDSNTNGETPLFEAARLGSNKLARLLVRQGMKAQIKNKFGQSALDIARENKFKLTLKALQQSK